MKLTIRNGQMRCIYDERLDLSKFGDVTVRRASNVEIKTGVEQDVGLSHIPTNSWYADMRPTAGSILGPFPSHAAAIAAEVKWLHENWLPQIKETPECQ